MKKFVLKRTCIALLTVFLILLLLFLMLDFMPGSPFNNEEKMSAEQIADLYHKYGLDQPIINRFFLYLKNMLHGDFGISYSLQVNMKISEMIGPKILVTIRLGLQAALVGTVIGALLGIIAALRKNTWVDTVTTIISVLGVSLPSFVFALLLSYFFGFKFKLFPFIYNTKNELQSSILPTISLSMFTIASVARYTRFGLLSSVRFKGTSEGKADISSCYSKCDDQCYYSIGSIDCKFNDGKSCSRESI